MAPDGEIHGIGVVNRNIGKDGFDLAIVQKVGIGEVEGKLEAFCFERQDDELLRIFYGERTPEYPVENAEDGGVCADAEAERQHGNHCETRALDEHAKCVAQVLQDIVHASSSRMSGRADE